jgi:hypothetical protein
MKMSNLFNNNFVYPSDAQGGRYVDLVGEIINVGQPSCIDEREGYIEVKTNKGTFSGYGYFTYNDNTGWHPKVGYFAEIHIYDCGGGWYPDNQVTSWGPKDYYIERYNKQNEQ